MKASRKNSILNIFSWILISISITMVYRYLDTYYTDWTPTIRNRLDIAHNVTRILLIVAIIITFLNAIFREIEHSFVFNRSITKRFFPLIKAVIVTIVWGVWIYYILDTLHINTTRILTWAWISGAIVLFASKDIFSNLLWSLSILFSHAFEIGERIRIILKFNATYEWIVEEITLNYTKITNFTGEVVFIPNRIIYTESVTNLSRVRFASYTYSVPFQRDIESKEVRTRLQIIEWKIMEYAPINISYDIEIPNATDMIYKITVLLPEEDEVFDAIIRNFLIDFIFSPEWAHSKVENLQN